MVINYVNLVAYANCNVDANCVQRMDVSVAGGNEVHAINQKDLVTEDQQIDT